MATKVTPELEEMLNLEIAMERSHHEFNESETGSSVSTKSSYSSVPDSAVLSSRAKAEWEKQFDKDFLEIEDRISRSTVELEEAYNSLKSRKKKKLEKDKLSEKNSVSKGNVDSTVELKESILGRMTEEGEDFEDTEFKERIPIKKYNLKNETSVSDGSEDKTTNKHIAEIEELEDKSLDETVGQELRNKTASQAFYASQERILRKIQKLEGQRKSSGSLKSDDQRNAAIAQNVDAVTNKQIEAKKNVYVLPENKIINKHKEEQDIIKRKDKISRALDTKVNVDATQKSNVSDSTKRTQIPKSRTGAVDDRQEVKDILEKQDTILRKALKCEEELEERQKSKSTKLMEPISSCRIDTVDDRQAETCIPLMDEETVSIDLNEERETSSVEVSQKNANGKTKWKYFRSLSGAKKSSVDWSDMRQRMRDRRNAASKACTCCTVFANAASKACTCCTVFASSVFLCFFYVAVIYGVSIAMVVIGSLYLDECPVQPYIPIYLVVGGSFGIFYNFISSCCQSDKRSCFDDIMSLFLFVWFILGCVWVYSVKHVEFYVTTDPDYCHKTCYNFAFWLLNVTFILLGALLGLACCAGCCVCLSG
ncbi:hypothetical protein JTE90_023571 [Oedothorax gibbosus]|uniref:Uncharacterized protein n=1 Tax=Oedothorax gibbosus TaxID=931172 RepID=A0AAV6UCH1_9ARAC|nr:hypothetical protein JTE90_023571 [Oedothorax gibbosus]